jgi:hypothetical protein|tara:strand:+ start:651 stop:992 length:342 start_codon:yes stop_codon:yes gene_type:complete
MHSLCFNSIVRRKFSGPKKLEASMKNTIRDAKIVAHFRHGLSSPDIAEAMGLSVSAVTHAIHDGVPTDERAEMVQKRRITPPQKSRGPKQPAPEGRENLLNAVVLEGRNLANR